MKKVVVSIQNGLLAEALTAMLNSNGDFQSYRVTSRGRDAAVRECVLLNADILLLEAAYADNSSVEELIRESQKVRQKLPDCKIVLLCDENSAPDIALYIRNAKKEGRIDSFFFTSVPSSYLLAALDAL